MTDLVTLVGDRLTVAISPLGAELQSIRDADGGDWLWDGDPAVWSGRAPILFPIVGRVANDAIRIGATPYPMPKHGFARRSNFDAVETAADHALFRLTDSDATRAHYPFAFTLNIEYRIAGSALDMIATLANPGAAPLPASFGFHPALRWPLPGGAPRADHVVRFPQPEPAPIRRIDASGLLTPAPHDTPVLGNTIALRDDLFVDDALIFDTLASRSLTYGAPGGGEVQVDFSDMPHLGIWTKPGAGFLCIEPWQGHSDPCGFTDEFRDKPGVIEVAPGESRRFAMRLRFAGPADEAPVNAAFSQP